MRLDSPSLVPTDSVRPASPGRPKDLGKRAAILDAAKHMFTTLGFEGASMDQIAAAAGVSKLTIYSHFGDKDSLYIAAVEAHCDMQLPASLFEPDPGIPLRPRLLAIAEAFQAMVSAPASVAGHRILCTPHSGAAHLPKLFWEAGPVRIQANMAGLLQRRVDAGQLEIAEPMRAASQFFALIKGDLYARQMLGYPAEANDAEIQAHLAASVDMFLRAYARR